jgi:hypothetical protein
MGSTGKAETPALLDQRRRDVLLSILQDYYSTG